MQVACHARALMHMPEQSRLLGATSMLTDEAVVLVFVAEDLCEG